jgi:predicted metal-dependent phosphoesterase TrpH
MREFFRYDTSERWYKGNIHVHTTVSDGGKTRAEVGELYAGAGYDSCFVTDQRCMV